MISSLQDFNRPASQWTGGFVFAAVFAFSSPVAAQDWFTAEACAVPKVVIDPSAIAPDELASFILQGADIANGHGRLWQITTPEGRVSHLWGTMHSSDRAVLDLPKAVRVLIEDATTVAIESDPTPDTRAAVVEMNQWDGFWAKGEIPWNAREDMDSDLMGWITARVVNLGYDASNIAQMTDAGLATLLLGDPCEDFSGRVIPFQDNYIATLAYLAGADVTGLEPPMPILNDLNRPEMAATARAMVESYGGYLAPWDGASGRGSYIALYQQGRIAEMILWNRSYAVKTHGAEKAAQIAALLDPYLLDGRNIRFASNARPLIDAGGAFLAVGAFHLPGEAGMVALLRNAGYLVKRVPLPGEAAP